MKRTIVRYKTKPERAEENVRLIEEVFQELHAKTPGGVRYLALRLGDGAFVHLATTEDPANPITSLDAFRAFQKGLRERCIEPPQVAEATVVGNYRMVGE
jgi:hypothetical protein